MFFGKKKKFIISIFRYLKVGYFQERKRKSRSMHAILESSFKISCAKYQTRVRRRTQKKKLRCAKYIKILDYFQKRNPSFKIRSKAP